MSGATKMKTNLKKIISTLLIAVMAATTFCALFACDGDGGATGASDDKPRIIIGSDEYTPYFFIGEDGEFSGADVEIAEEAFSRIGYVAEFKMIDWVDKDTILENGEVDCLWGSFTMTGREDRYDWAGPYLTSRQIIVVPQNSAITKLSDLTGKSVACQSTGKVDEVFSAADGSDNIPVLSRLYCFDSFELAFAAMRKNYVDAIGGHEIALMDYIENLSGEYRALSEPLLEVEIGAAFKKDGGRGISDKLTETLKEMAADGTTASIVVRYGIEEARVITK